LNELTSRERVLRALRRETPDRVPHFEWLVDRKVREALCPGCRDHNDFAARMGHDAVLTAPSFEKTAVGANRRRSEWGFITAGGAEEHDIEVEGPIRTMNDLDRYTPPDVELAHRYEAIERTVSTYGGAKAVGVHLNDVFSLPRHLMGMENLLCAVAAEPDLVKALVEMSVDLNLRMAGEAAARGVDFVWTGDDYACNTGPLMSPDHFRRLFYPGLCRVIGGFKELGLPVVKHTDGMIWPIIEMIVDAGIDALDPIDPLAGMDLGEVKAAYGDRVALKGNVDCSRLLSFGTPEAVSRATVEALRAGAPGGGFILSSSNSIHSSVKPENYMAMLDTLREHGTYPLRV
jgi:uroporphyrinogen decarboxylase